MKTELFPKIGWRWWCSSLLYNNFMVAWW